jgi:hypothetical protein
MDLLFGKRHLFLDRKSARAPRGGHHIATLRDLLVLGLPGPTTGNKNLVAGRRAPGSEEAKW